VTLIAKSPGAHDRAADPAPCATATLAVTRGPACLGTADVVGARGRCRCGLCGGH
jgi:hypothetical protein